MHLDEAHQEEGDVEDDTVPTSEPAPAAPRQEVPPPASGKPKKQKTLDGFVDRRMTDAEQENAQLGQAFALVMSGHSYNSLDQQ